MSNYPEKGPKGKDKSSDTHPNSDSIRPVGFSKDSGFYMSKKNLFCMLVFPVTQGPWSFLVFQTTMANKWKSKLHLTQAKNKREPQTLFSPTSTEEATRNVKETTAGGEDVEMRSYVTEVLSVHIKFIQALSTVNSMNILPKKAGKHMVYTHTCSPKLTYKIRKQVHIL